MHVMSIFGISFKFSPDIITLHSIKAVFAWIYSTTGSTDQMSPTSFFSRHFWIASFFSSLSSRYCWYQRSCSIISRSVRVGNAGISSRTNVGLPYRTSNFKIFYHGCQKHTNKCSQKIMNFTVSGFDTVISFSTSFHINKKKWKNLLRI